MSAETSSAALASLRQNPLTILGVLLVGLCVGMALFADGGIMGSKPYAASGAYINRMSDYCGACAYDPKQSSGPGACPFNALYWDFMARHAERLAGNIRMAMPLRTLERMAPARIAALREQAGMFLDAMDRGDLV